MKNLPFPGNVKNSLKKVKIYPENLTLAPKRSKSGYLNTYQQVKEQFHTKRSLDIIPFNSYISPENGKFFLPHQLYSNLKDDIMTEVEYENVKKFYQTMKLKDLGELSKIYNFQDTIILCEIFENCENL